MHLSPDQRNERPHGIDMSRRPNPKVRQWRRPRKSNDSDMLLVRNDRELLTMCGSGTDKGTVCFQTAIQILKHDIGARVLSESE